MQIRSIFIAVLVFFASQNACSAADVATPLNNGDILFVEYIDSEISGAINRVTQTERANNYSHVGIVELDSYGVAWLIHAAPEAGVERIELSKYVEREQEDLSQIDIYRLKQKHQRLVPEAIVKAKQYVGLPYNFSYIPNEQEFYCSDLIQRIFAQNDVFNLEPMTFVNPQTGSIDQTWLDYYGKLGVEVPEGLPGCNPNGLAGSENIDFIAVYFMAQ